MLGKFLSLFRRTLPVLMQTFLIMYAIFEYALGINSHVIQILLKDSLSRHWYRVLRPRPRSRPWQCLKAKTSWPRT